jgi:hypothetical protein
MSKLDSTPFLESMWLHLDSYSSKKKNEIILSIVASCSSCNSFINNLCDLFFPKFHNLLSLTNYMFIIFSIYPFMIFIEINNIKCGWHVQLGKLQNIGIIKKILEFYKDQSSSYSICYKFPWELFHFSDVLKIDLPLQNFWLLFAINSLHVILIACL